MIKKSRFITILIMVAFLSACSTYPDQINPSYTDSDFYAQLSCEDLLQKREEISAELERLSSDQSRFATTDTVLVVTGLLFTIIPLFFIGWTHDDHEIQIANLKGQLDAIDDSIISNCPA